MIGEREYLDSDTNYGSLTMRAFDIDGNEINAFYDSLGKLVFVLDNTINERKPNVLLVINPDADKKWDEILSGDYGVDLETIRPKQDNKYQKLDIEYSGLPVYDALINAYNDGTSLEEALNQLAVLRDSAARHSAMMRLNMANEIIAKTNATIVKTKESILRLQARIKTLRAKLAEAKKGIGRVPTKQSAAKILKLESQIEAANEKLKRAKERLKSAQRRLETATVDAELAGDLLNQPEMEIKQMPTNKKTRALATAPRHEVVKKKEEVALPQIIEDSDYEDKDDDEEIEEPAEEIEEEVVADSDDSVKPLFNEDPQIMNQDIAFKPISFEAPTNAPEKQETENVPVLNQDMFLSYDDTDEDTEEKVTEKIEEKAEEKPVLESMMPVISVPEYSVPKEETTFDNFEPVVEEENVVEQERPVLETMTPMPSMPRQQEPVFDEKLEDSVELDEDYVVNINSEEKPEEKIQEAQEETEVLQEPDAQSQEPDMPAPIVPEPVVPMLPSKSENVAVVTSEAKTSKPTFIYYLLLVILIVLAVFTLWLYQRNVKTTSPVLTATVEQTENVQKTTLLKKQKPKVEKKVELADDSDADLFLDEVPEDKAVVQQEPESVPVEEIPDIIDEPQEPVDVMPEVIDAVPARVMTSAQSEEEPAPAVSEEDVLASKPVYEPGTKHDEMFVAQDDYVEDDGLVYVSEDYVDYNNNEDNPYYDAEEAAYQAEQENPYYED